MPQSQYETAIVAGDFNNDGNFDLVTANSLLSSVSIILGNGFGSFGLEGCGLAGCDWTVPAGVAGSPISRTLAATHFG